MGAEHIPTMPQNGGSGHIPTMPQDGGSGHVPTMPQGAGSGHVPTMPQGSDAGSGHMPTMPQGTGEGHEPTVPQGTGTGTGHTATVPQDFGYGAASNPKKQLLSYDIKYTGEKGTTYTVRASERIHVESGESEIYKAVDSGNNKFVARIPTKVRPFDKEKSRKRRHVIDFLKENSRNNANHLLPLSDEGTVQINGEEYFIEIYPYCEGGDLGNKSGRLSYDFLKNKVIPDINEALHVIHENGFIHRDLKPDNLYEYKNGVVIGDFGIMTEVMDAAHNLDLNRVGSLGYYAPELNAGSFDKQSDYYSFGQTIFTLYTGHLMYQEEIDLHAYESPDIQRNAIFQRALNDDFSLEDIKEDELRTLISGLLQNAYKSRFGYNEVRRWVNGEAESLKHSLRLDDYGDDYKVALTIDSKDLWNDSALTDFIPGHEKSILDYFYELEFTHFFRSTTGRNSEAEAIEEIRRRYGNISGRGQKEDALALAELSLVFSHGKKLYCDGELIDSFHAFSKKLEGSPRLSSPEWDILSHDLLSKWFDAKEGKAKDRDAEDRRKSIFNICLLANGHGTAKAAWYYAYFLLTPDEKNRELYGYKKIGDYFASLMDVSQPKKFYDSDPTLDNKIWGKLVYDGYFEQVKAIIEEFENFNLYNAYQLFFQFLDTQDDDGLKENRETFRKYYYTCGPNGGFSYWQKNIDIYTANGSDALSLINKIRSVKLSPDMPIADQVKAVSELKQLKTEFDQYFNNNYMLSLAGFLKKPTANKNYIYSRNVSGYFSFLFMSQPAPIGFKKLMGM